MIAIPIILSLVLLVLDIIKNRKIYSPGVVFNGITFVTLFMYSFRLSEIQQDLSGKTILLLTLCIVAFNLPVLIVYFVKRKNITDSKIKAAAPEFKIYETSKWLDLVLFIIILTLFLIEVIYNQGIPLAWKFLNTNKVYVDFGMPYLHSIFTSLLMLVGGYSLFKKKCYYKWFYLSIPILIISRALLASMVIKGLIMYIIVAKNKPKLFWCYLFIAGFVGLLLFGLIGNFRTGQAEFLAVAQFKPWADWLPSSFKWAYAYLCFSVSNLNNLISMTPGFVNYGASSLDSILPPGWQLPENAVFNFLVSPNFTVSGFAPSLYLDFGLAGPIILCLLIGILSIYLFSKINVSEVSVLFYAIVLYSIIFIWYSSPFIYTPFILQMILIPVIFVLPRLFKQRRKNERNNLGGGKRDQVVSVDGGNQ